MPKKKYKLILRPLIVASIIWGVTIYFMVICQSGLNKSYVEDGWKQTQGIILDAQTPLEEKHNKDRISQGIEQTISYEFTVNGKKYRSNSVSKEQFVDATKYPQGKTVTVYYNPGDITDSVLLRTNVQKQYLYATMVFCVFILIATIVFFIKDVKYALDS